MKIYFIGSLLVSFIILTVFAYNIFNYKLLLAEKKIKSIVFLFLRSFSVLMLLILFIDPHLFYYSIINKEKKLNVFIDNSMSIKYQNITVDSIADLIEELDEVFINENIKTNFFIFGDSLKLYNRKILDFNDNQTNFTDVQNYINNHINSYNLVITDGNSSHGYRLLDLKFNNAVNFIGIGKFTHQDVSISNVEHQNSVIRGDSIHLNIEISSELDSAMSSEIFISSNNKILSSKVLKLDKGLNVSHIKQKISTDKINGEIDFHIKTSKKIDENNFNNFYKTRIHLIDNNKKILLLSGSLNSNTQEIKLFLSLIPQVNVEHLYKINKDWNALLDNLNYEDYELIVYDNFPSNTDDFRIHSLINKNINKNTRLIYFEGPAFNVETINNIFEYQNINFDISNNDIKNNFIEVYDRFENLPSTRKNYIFKQKYFDKIHLSYLDKSVAIGEKIDRLYIFIPELSSLSLKDKLDRFRNSLSDIIYLFMDKGGDIQLNIKKREVAKGENVELKLDIPKTYSSKSVDIIIENIDNLSESSTIRLNKIKKNESGIRYLENMFPGEYNIYCRVLLDSIYYSSEKIKLTVTLDDYEINSLYRNASAMKGLSLKTKGNYYPIEDYKNIKSSFFSSAKTLNKKNEINMHTLHNYWFIMLLTLIIEWFLRKRKGLL